MLFLAMGTQWNFAGMTGQRVGLKYEVIEATAALSGVALEPREPLFGWLRDMEQDVLKADAERAKARP